MIDKDIMDFIKGNNLATVCATAGDAPYCFNCFYAVMEAEGCLVLKSGYNTRHLELIAQNKHVAGTITADTVNPAILRGIQFQGTATGDNMMLNMQASAAYYLRFPMSMAIPGKLWIVELDEIKFTDYTKGLQYRGLWQRNSSK